MSWRAIQDDVPYSLSLAELSDGAERLYFRMVCQADAWGRLEVGSAEKLRLRVAPAIRKWSARKVEGFMRELAESRVNFYDAEGVLCAQILDWEKNQPKDVLGRNGVRFKSAIPEPPLLQGKRRGAAGRGDLPPEIEIENEVKNTSTVEEVYRHWRTVWAKSDPRYNAISAKRERRIKDRLKEFSVEELCKAIDGSRRDPWDKRPANSDLVVLLRDREQVERFLEMAEGPNGNGRREVQYPTPTEPV